MQHITPSEADIFAWRERRDYEVYTALARHEKDQKFKNTLLALAGQESADFAFWSSLASKKDFHVSRWTIWIYLLMRRVFGLVFTAKYLEQGERKTVATYESLRDRMDKDSRVQFESMIAHEREHEQKLIAMIREERLDFVGNIVLGLNDGLIELTGALVGFSFAFGDTRLAALTGLITGIAATLSMASSAYMQAKYDNEERPLLAASYTGGAYLVVVALLIIPFFVFSSVVWALSSMGAIVLAIIAAVTGYGAIVFHRSFIREFAQMTSISLGVSLITFGLGFAFRAIFGVSI